MHIKTNWLDRTITAIAPAKGAARMAARAQVMMLQSAFDGASPSHRNSSRRYRAGDANSAVRSGAKRLRFAVRDFIRNNPLAARVPQVWKSNVIGTGIIPNVEKVRSAAKRDALQLIVNDHCDTVCIDAAGRQNLYGLQATAFAAAVSDGASLMVRRRARASEGLPLPFQISVLEIDYLDDRVTGILANGNIAVDGIEFSRTGSVVAYHLFERHPGDTTVFASLSSTRFLAEDVVHLYRIDRPGQAHGVSWLAPVIVRLGDLEDTKDAYILRQKIAACFAVFVKKSAAAGAPQNVGQTSAGNRLEVIEPGMIEVLGDGEDVTFGSPPAVGDIEAFFRVGARDIAVGTGMTYEALTGDLSGVNFSSGRMGWLEFYRNIASTTEHMVMPQMCAPIGRWITEGLRLMASVPSGARIGWTPPRREMIDPEKELKAAAEAARSGLGTLSRWLRGQGYDPETVDNERAEELKRHRRLGLNYDTDVGAAGANAATDLPAEETQET